MRECYYQNDNDAAAQIKSQEKLLQLIKDYDPDYIFLSALFNSCYSHIGYIQQAIMESGTNARVVMGGGFATTQYQSILDEFERIDMLSIAEGEIAIKAILENEIPFFELYKYHASLVTRQSLKENIIPHPEFLDDLNQIPPLDFSLLHNDIYSKQQIIFNTSRGCPFHCIFCAAHVMAGKKIRAYSEERIIADFVRYYEMGYREYVIFDENFFFYRERALSILNFMAAYKGRDVAVSFPCGAMVARIDDEIAKVLASLRVKDIGLALESGSERVLKDIIKKPLKISDLERAISALKKYGIERHVFIVSGLPGETDADRKITTDLLKQMDVTWVSFNLAMPMVGSHLYDICVQNHWLVDNEVEKSRMWGAPCIELPEYSASYLKEAVYRMNLDVNFIHNAEVRNGEYQQAVKRFKHIAAAYEDHAFAFYMLALCCYKLQEPQWREYYMQYLRIIGCNQVWKTRSDYFGLHQSEHPEFGEE